MQRFASYGCTIIGAEIGTSVGPNAGRTTAASCSLIVTCRLHKIDVYTYLVDVLQRVGQHPAARVAELTPRLWKQHFAPAPLRSALHDLAA
jgi:hypothetical protein